MNAKKILIFGAVAYFSVGAYLAYTRAQESTGSSATLNALYAKIFLFWPFYLQ